MRFSTLCQLTQKLNIHPDTGSIERCVKEHSIQLESSLKGVVNIAINVTFSF